MTTLQAHELLAELHHRDPERLQAMLPCDCEPRIIGDIDTSVTLLAAACELSGQLEDAETLEDLEAAAEHFASLFNAEVISLTEWNCRALEIIGELVSWGERVTAYQRN